MTSRYSELSINRTQGRDYPGKFSFSGEKDVEKPRVPLTMHLHCLNLEWTLETKSII